jgi:hypothetical protein
MKGEGHEMSLSFYTEKLHKSKQPRLFTNEIRKAKEISDCFLFLLTEDAKWTFRIKGEEKAYLVQ